MKKIVLGIAIIALAVTGLFAKEAKKGKVQKVRVAHTNYYVPYDFVNDKGESDGFEVAVLKEIDKLLPDYEFELFPTSDDDLLIGVLQGKYDFGTKGIWITEERKKKYVFPKNPIGASVIGIVVRTETTDQWVRTQRADPPAASRPKPLMQDWTGLKNRTMPVSRRFRKCSKNALFMQRRLSSSVLRQQKNRLCGRLCFVSSTKISTSMQKRLRLMTS